MSVLRHPPCPAVLRPVRHPAPHVRLGRLTRLSAGLVAAGLLLGALTARADDDDRPDQDRARAAVRAGEVLPLPQLLERVKRQVPGQVLAVELERENGRWRYELRLLQPGGQLLKLEVDARTGQVLRQRARPEGAR